MKNKYSSPKGDVGLKVGGVPEHFNFPWRLAIEEGLFREQGVSLHWSDMSGGTGQMIKGLRTGSIDVAVVLTEGITRAILQGLNTKILRVFVASPLCWGIHVPYHSRFKEINQLDGQTFAISREASGSHLMAYVLGHKSGWKKKLNFNVVGDIYGGLWALENNEADAFLWEKYTTNPYVGQKKCRRIGDIVTPWSSFVIAVRDEVIHKYPEALEKMCDVVIKKASEVKKASRTAEVISWRYNIDLCQIKKWLSQTVWSDSSENLCSSHEEVVSYLLNLGLISTNEAKDWDKKLFL
tara:strand:- start:1231 stop:2115 length:885 start_codon:yes stop_codon:yes gene_type:complete